MGESKEIKGRKVVVEIDLHVKGEVFVRGQVVAVQIPENMLPAN